MKPDEDKKSQNCPRWWRAANPIEIRAKDNEYET
jgi:hypothetical protein